MADRLDVAGRLAEGHQAVDDVQRYVWASHLIGYHHRNLTLHPAQVRDWYGTEDGMDLRALDADCAALHAAVAATEHALRLQDAALATLSGAWQGGGAETSWEFLRHHGEASYAAAAAVRRAADTLAALRDNLWQMIDGKVAAAIAIDDRRRAERGQWLAAVSAVTTGTGDRAAASELIDQQVKPFVDNDIRLDWLTAMRVSEASVDASYDAATTGLTAEPGAVFAVPGDLGPSWAPSDDAGWLDEPVRSGHVATTSPAAAPAGTPPIVPAAGSAPAAVPSTSAAVPPDTMPEPVSTPPAAVTPAALTPAAPTDAAGALTGLGQRLSDAIGGLLSQFGDGLPEPPELDELDEPDEPDVAEDGAAVEADEEPPDDETESDDAAPDDQEATGEIAGEEATVDEVVGDTVGACDAQPPDQPLAGPPPTPVPPTPVPPTPVPAPPPMPVTEPPPDPLAAGETPCEIAADELPQAGP